jgi:cellulose biosynthesis protein BcsQ
MLGSGAAGLPGDPQTRLVGYQRARPEGALEPAMPGCLAPRRRGPWEAGRKLDVMNGWSRVGTMLISSWSHKGSVGKTTVAAQLVPALGAKVLDLDGPDQYDLSKWAVRSGVYHEKLLPEHARERLIAAANDELNIWWADCHPGDQLASNLNGIAFSDIVVVVVRGGGATDLEQLGRCAGRIDKVRATFNPDLRMAVIFNGARETARDRAGEAVVRSWANVNNAPFLGSTKLRDIYPVAWDRGESVLFLDDVNAKKEMTVILQNLTAMLPRELAPPLPPRKYAGTSNISTTSSSAA